MEEIKTINIEDEQYPKILKEIPDPPKTLYVKGDLDIDGKSCFAVVGTRRCSDYGKQITLEIACGLAEAGIIIVSGMARGIDTLAHKASLEQKGKTIAVLGSGIDEKSIYPQENLRLAQRIIDGGGAVISEFPAGTPGYKGNFPLRNRIISGLSQGVLIVEAKFKSGALITAHRALTQGKKIFAVPGPIHGLNSRGPNKLIKEGKAKLVENADDILKELNLSCLRFNLKRTEEGKNKEENLILKTLKEGTLHIDKIVEKTKLPVPIVVSALAMLEIKNKVRELGGKIYALRH